MGLTDVCGGGPSDAERIRSVLAGAGSLSLTTGGNCYDLIGMHTVDGKGQLRLHAPDDSPLAAEAACAPRGVLAALLEFTDVAPTAVRDRVRGRVTLSGWLTACGEDREPGVCVLRLDTARATLEKDGAVADVGLDEVVLAEADPLASEEAGLLTHMADDHVDVVTALSRLGGPELLVGVERIRPYALDRYGITLRCEYARTHRDLRILFPTPLRHADDIGSQVDALLAAARHCPHHQDAHDRP